MIENAFYSPRLATRMNKSTENEEKGGFGVKTYSKKLLKNLGGGTELEKECSTRHLATNTDQHGRRRP
jgi:hypothetical protein